MGLFDFLLGSKSSSENKPADATPTCPPSVQHKLDYTPGHMKNSEYPSGYVEYCKKYGSR